MSAEISGGSSNSTGEISLPGVGWDEALVSGTALTFHPLILNEGLGLCAAENFYSNQTGSNFTQSNHRGFVAITLNQWGATHGDLTRTVSRRQRKLKTIGNVLDAIIDGNTSHEL
jgi:hypothetical protein